MKEEESITGDSGENGQLSRREKRMQRHRLEILEAAKELFAANGYDGTSMQMIAGKVELSVGKLYTHFEGKESIYLEIARLLHERMMQVSDDSCRPGMTKLEELRARINAISRLMYNERDFMRINREMNYGCRHMLDKMDQRAHTSVLLDLIGEAVEEGELELGFDPSILSILMEGGAMGYVDEFFEDDEKMRRLPEYLDLVFLKQFETKKTGRAGDDKKENR